MVKMYKYEDKNYELALQKCMIELNETEENLYIKTEETEGKLFKSKKVILTVITKKSVKEYIKNYIQTIESGMGIEINSEIKEEEGIFNVILVSNDNAILIGKDGRTLNALQLLIRQALQTETGFNIKVNLDAGNYKAKKIKNFEYEMKKILKEVQETKVDVKLDPMNSYQRRIVHNLANNFENITTCSEGLGSERHIVIHYKED